MRVMITGGLGVNGAWLVRELLGRGHEVAVLENRDDTSLIEDVAERVEVVIGDITDADGTNAAVAGFGPDAVVHLAAMVDCDRFPQAAVSVNVTGTVNICAAAAAAGVKRLVHTSTKGVYTPGTGELGHPTYAPIAEDTHVGPIGMYGITKRAAEDVVDWCGRTTEVECVNLRFGTIFGPGRLQRHAGSINTYSSMVELPARGEPFVLEHGGDEGDDIVYVLDVADAIATVVLAPDRLRHPTYNIAHGSVLTMNEYAAAIRRVIPGAALEVGPGLNPMDYVDPYYMALDGSRIADELGWRPQYDADRAVQHYYDLVSARPAGADA